LLAVILPLIGAGAFLYRHKDQEQIRLRSELQQIRSRIRSGEIIPTIIELMREVVNDSGDEEAPDIEVILSTEKYYRFIESLAESQNTVSQINYTYQRLISTINSLADDFIKIGVSGIILSIWHLAELDVRLFEINLFFLAILFPLYFLSNIAERFLIYKNLKDYLSNKYDEIILDIT